MRDILEDATLHKLRQELHALSPMQQRPTSRRDIQLVESALRTCALKYSEDLQYVCIIDLLYQPENAVG